MPEFRPAEAAISETMFYMSFSLGFILLKIHKAPARAPKHELVLTGFNLKSKQS